MTENITVEEKRAGFVERLAFIENKLFLAKRDLHRAARRFHETPDESALAQKAALVAGLEISKAHWQRVVDAWTAHLNQQGQAA